MKFLAFYSDPKKKRLQFVELALLVVALPIALVWGASSFQEWSNFRQAEALVAEADVAVHQGRNEEAVAAFEKSVTLYPEYYAAWEGLGSTYHMTKQHDKELAAYQRAVSVLPQRAELHRELGTAYHESGDHKSELKHLEIASGLFTTDEAFTAKLLERAERELAGTYPMVSVAAKGPESSPTPSLDIRDHQDHGHDHDHP